MENKNKLPTFWVGNKNFSQNLVFALEKLVLCCPDPGSGSGLGKKSWIRIRKKLIRIRNTDWIITCSLAGCSGGGEGADPQLAASEQQQYCPAPAPFGCGQLKPGNQGDPSLILPLLYFFICILTVF